MRAEDRAGEGPDKDEIEGLRHLVDGARRIVALTGAGISTESGIPDFRSPGGLWTRVKPITYQEFAASEEARMEDWRRRFAMNRSFAEAEPNSGHRLLALLAEEGRLAALVTQNIDGLHQRAGFPPELIIEIHGHATHGRCLDCGAPMALDAIRRRIDETGASPRCGCGGLVKAAIISFGEAMPAESMRRASDLAASADLFLVLGSSLLVQPAATLPLLAKRAGARLAIVNRDRTTLDDMADVLVRKGIGEVAVALRPQLVN